MCNLFTHDHQHLILIQFCTMSSFDPIRLHRAQSSSMLPSIGTPS
ncbi:hypothetical protein M6B38_402175 [Iris pallida]|uniref:Uncharacterized protein n=1 Tax=Iris pallida TaxID=29817 RepID=A0AAX6FTB8_IRIPA|nr:hypothetical protein M6B38_402175 [Iris pallida]